MTTIDRNSYAYRLGVCERENVRLREALKAAADIIEKDAHMPKVAEEFRRHLNAN